MTAAADVLVVGLIGLGTLCMLLAAVGVNRMPDLFTRMQASSKASTLGVILILIAGAVWFAQPAVTVRAVLIALFLAITTPVGAHMIARAGYLAGVRMADEDAPDALAGRYEAGTDRLSGTAGGGGESDGTHPSDG